MNIEKPKIITIEAYGRKFTAELPWDADMNEITDSFKGLLLAAGFHIDTINAYVGSHEDNSDWDITLNDGLEDEDNE